MRRDREKYNSSRSPHSGSERDMELRGDHATSPNSIRSGHPVASSASSMVSGVSGMSGNWRSSMSTTSSAGTTLAFTRYSNGSLRSVSTAATWGSATSWRTNSSDNSEPQPLSAPTPTNLAIPKNIKIMNGVPWELNQLPRGQEGTILESPPASQRSPDFPRRDAAMRTSNLSVPGPGEEVGDGPKKVSKAHINALAKMLSALRQ
ncbi:hypothetical protein C8J57DRAFT_1282006 [Mycena rebaudengoi]|nr:hypothetical protein C8J57DRAFT_1282006 [Mycena rebaudengoi]